MATLPRISVEERRARLGVRHHLASGHAGGSPVAVAASMMGLHATDPATVFMSLWARVEDVKIPDVEAALYDERSLVRQLAMRRTLWAVPAVDLDLVLGASSLAVAATERRRLLGYIDASDVPGRASTYLDRMQQAALEGLDRAGGAHANELSRAVPELARKLVAGAGTKWAAEVSVNSRVLGLLNMEGRVMRGRPRGSWLGTQHRWVTTEQWLGRAPAPHDPPVARAELARRWLGAFGPATVEDLRWWAGWTLGQARAALAAVDAVEVDLDGATGLVLLDDLEPVGAVAPWVALLPGLDPTTMGWKQRAWYLGEHKAPLFDRSGNAGPTIWCDGRIVGGWGQREDGAVVVRLLEDVGAEAAAAVDARAAELEAWLAGTRVTPRFRAPLELELAQA